MGCSSQFQLPLQSEKMTMLSTVTLLILALTTPVFAYPSGAPGCVYRPRGPHARP